MRIAEKNLEKKKKKTHKTEEGPTLTLKDFMESQRVKTLWCHHMNGQSVKQGKT